MATMRPVMSEQQLELIKTVTLFLNEGIPSGDVVLDDKAGGDIYLNFVLRYSNDGTSSRSTFSADDEHHAQVTIHTRPGATTRFASPALIGTYGNSKGLYLYVVAEPKIEGAGHRTTIMFYTNKE